MKVLNASYVSPKAPFDRGQCKIALQETGRYLCASNYLTVDHAKSATRGVRFNEDAINRLMAFHFAQPAPPPMAITCAVARDAVPTNGPSTLTSVTPLELRLALLKAVVRDIQRSAPEDVMQSWKQILLSCPFEYKILENEDDIWRAGRQIRYALAQDSLHLKLTALQEMRCTTQSELQLYIHIYIYIYIYIHIYIDKNVYI